MQHPVLPSTVTQPTPVRVIEQPTPSPYERYLAKKSIVLGGIQVAVGVATILLASVYYGLYYMGNDYRYSYLTIASLQYTGYGYVFPVFYILAVCLAIVAGKRKTKCPVIANLVLSFVAALFAFCHMALASSDVVYDDYYSSPPASRYAVYQGFMAMKWLLVILGVLELVVAMWSSALGCQVSCCDMSPLTSYKAGSQQVVNINSGGQPGPQAGYVVAPAGQPGTAVTVAAQSAPSHLQQTAKQIG